MLAPLFLARFAILKTDIDNAQEDPPVV